MYIHVIRIQLLTRYCCHGSYSFISRCGCGERCGLLSATPTNLDPTLILVILHLPQLQLTTEGEALKREIIDPSCLEVALDLREGAKSATTWSDVEDISSLLIHTHPGPDNASPPAQQGRKDCRF